MGGRSMDSGPCYVYWLLDPWTEGCPPFYVGISNNPWDRFRSHCHDRLSAAHRLLNLFLKHNVRQEEILVVLKKCETRREAVEIEYQLFMTTPDLLNRPYRKGRAY